ncbi:D-alanine--D-alanine ligase [Afifella sp. H1R]|uniref:D-alanine--D-alanine ligase family protein n=1 Tax=Afifella sp. H1R TaxID=2908841 RepID=UPI001F3F8996|nr:D-alanine--D-alanine ligase family protein [Afifella sp. H1R]MCF1504858.1 D-alanine--D-alanine ligase [Afifella sp. H1R]
MTPPSSRTRIAVLFGGRSAEHDVSIMSATNVMRALDPETYDLVPIFITRDGRWLESRFEDGRPTTPETGTELALLSGGKGRMLALSPEGQAREITSIDILFPVLHGLFGEDGSIQGLAETAGVAFVGCGILGSATAIDKDIAKRLLMQAGLPVAHAVTIALGEAPSFTEIEGALGLPLFVKPARQGSSVGVSKVTSEAGFAAALAEGFRHDTRLLAEEFIAGREIECAVLEDPKGALFVSRPGEIVPAERHGFYSYDAKYIDETGAALKVPADLPPHLEAEIRTLAAKAFRALGCDGMARVDFFVTAEGRILVNELNTIPGFTDISMYSKAMSASGVGYAEVIDRLVEHGLARAAG